MYKLPNSVDNLVDIVSGLPGIGPKSATKLVLSLITTNRKSIEALSNSLKEISSNIGVCQICGNIVEKNEPKCDICQDDNRDDSLMIVESVLDLINIENSGAFKGYYHVLNGLVSPIRAVSLNDLNVNNLLARFEERNYEKVIVALPSNIEGDTTALLIKDLIESKYANLNIFRLGRGLPTGANIEFLDADTLKSSISNITQY